MMFLTKTFSALALIASIGASALPSSNDVNLKRQDEVYPWTVECEYIWSPDPHFNLTAEEVQVSINYAVSVNTSAHWNFNTYFLGSVGPYTNLPSLPSQHSSTTNNSRVYFQSSVYMRPNVTRHELKEYMASWTGWKIYGGFDGEGSHSDVNYHWTVEYDRCY